MADPSNLMAINEVKFLTGYDVKVAVAAPTVIQHSIERYYDSAHRLRRGAVASSATSGGGRARRGPRSTSRSSSAPPRRRRSSAS
jgi:hypothetical protein